MANEYRSARRFKNPPPLFRWADAQGYFSEPADALVFGAGLLREAIELYLQRLQKHGEPIPPGIEEEVIQVAG